MNAVSSVIRADEEGRTTAAALRCALQSAYKHLDDCIAHIELATATPVPNMALVANVRYRIGQASYARRQLVHKACDHLLDRVSLVDAETLRSLKRADAAYVRISTEHIRCWPRARVEQEWAGYREASRRIRAEMKQAIRNEQLRLFPLLVRYEATISR